MDDTQLDMAALALELVGEFSKLQESVDQMVRMYVTKRAPGLATFLDEENILDRIPDQQRPRLVLAIATELGTEADVSQFRDVFYRVKDIRDFMAHGTYTQRIDADKLVIWNNYVSGPDVKRRGIKKRASLDVTRDQLTARLKEVRWLLQHVNFIVGSSDLTTTIYLGDREVAFTQPPADPTVWDGNMFTFQR